MFAGGISFAPLYFVGLGILATEFDWARRLVGPARKRYDAVMAWYGHRVWWVRALWVALTAAVVLAAFWLAGLFGWLGVLFGLETSWLHSPLGPAR